MCQSLLSLASLCKYGKTTLALRTHREQLAEVVILDLLLLAEVLQWTDVRFAPSRFFSASPTVRISRRPERRSPYDQHANC